MKGTFFVSMLLSVVLAGCSINASNKQCGAKNSAVDVYAKYANKLLSEGKYEMAQRMANRAEKTAVAWNIELMAIKARVLLAEERPDILQNGDSQMLKTDIMILKGEKAGMDADIKVIQGHLALSVRNFDKAAKIYKDALAEAPDKSGAYFGMGWVYRLTGKTDEAVKAYTAGLKISPDNYGALISLADLAMATKKYGDAEKYYSHAVDISPESIGATKGLVRALYLQKKVDKALALLDNLIIRAPKDRDVFMWRGEILAGKKKWPETIQMIARALQLGAGSNAAVLLARSYLELKQYPMAESVLRRALKQDRGNFQLSYLMAVTLDHLGRKVAALGTYKSILNVLESANPKVSAQLTDVKKACKDAIARLSNEVSAKKKVGKKKR